MPRSSRAGATIPEAEVTVIGARLEERMRKTFHRNLTMREVSAGSCNGLDALFCQSL